MLKRSTSLLCAFSVLMLSTMLVGAPNPTAPARTQAQKKPAETARDNLATVAHYLELQKKRAHHCEKEMTKLATQLSYLIKKEKSVLLPWKATTLKKVRTVKAALQYQIEYRLRQHQHLQQSCAVLAAHKKACEATLLALNESMDDAKLEITPENKFLFKYPF